MTSKPYLSKLRCCLGAMPRVSEQILGNTAAAANYGLKGRLIINTNPAMENNSSLNISLRTPFLPAIRIGNGKSLYDYLQYADELGKKVKQSGSFNNLSFYDEDALIPENTFEAYVHDRSSNTQFYLGEPSFVLRNPDGESWLRIDLKRNPSENILVFTALEKNRKIFLKTLLYNLKGYIDRNSAMGTQVLCYYGSEEFLNMIDIGIFTKTERVRQYSPELEEKLNVVKWRRLVVDADTLAFSGIKLVDEDMKLVEELLSSSPQYLTEIYKKRAQAIINLVRGDNAASFGWTKTNDAQIIARCISVCFSQYEKFGCAVKRLVPSMFSMTYIFCTSVEVWVGLGRDGKTKNVDTLKSIMADSSEYKIVFVLATGNMEDCAGIRSAFNHAILDLLKPNQVSQLKILDDYPEQINVSLLGVYYSATSETNKCRKFKKLKLKDDEEF